MRFSIPFLSGMYCPPFSCVLCMYLHMCECMCVEANSWCRKSSWMVFCGPGHQTQGASSWYTGNVSSTQIMLVSKDWVIFMCMRFYIHVFKCYVCAWRPEQGIRFSRKYMWWWATMWNSIWVLYKTNNQAFPPDPLSTNYTYLLIYEHMVCMTIAFTGIGFFTTILVPRRRLGLLGLVMSAFTCWVILLTCNLPFLSF